MKWFALLGLMLFLGVAVAPSTSGITDNIKTQLKLAGNILYVGGSGPGNYTRIQNAVNNATDGDTIYVYAGNYTDHNLTNHAMIFITISITLQGENKNTTLLDGSFEKSIIRIATSNVTIHGFTIQHSGRYFASPPPAAIYLNPGGPTIVQNIQIYDTIIQNNWVGIGMRQTQNISIYKNTIRDNKWGCSLIDTEDTHSLHQNRIISNELGIWINTGGKTTLNNNIIQDNQQGIQASNSHANITRNNFIHNQRDTRFSLDMQFLDLFRQTGHNHWESNYWDKWKLDQPKPILGTISLYIALLIFPVPLIIPLGTYPLIRFDKHPAQEPYDIG